MTNKQMEIVGKIMIVVGVSMMMPLAIDLTKKGIKKVKFNKKIKQGLKDGSIVKKDDQYYRILDSGIYEMVF